MTGIHTEVGLLGLKLCGDPDDVGAEPAVGGAAFLTALPTHGGGGEVQDNQRPSLHWCTPYLVMQAFDYAYSLNYAPRPAKRRSDEATQT